jgi:hypothetical protein
LNKNSTRPSSIIPSLTILSRHRPSRTENKPEWRPLYLLPRHQHSDTKQGKGRISMIIYLLWTTHLWN